MKSTFAFAFLLGSTSALCPGDSPCSGHGSCGEHDKCACYVGYTGQDCSSRTCNHHTSWNAIAEETVNSNDVDGAPYKAVKHVSTECASKGDCDRDSGECKCFEGFTGKGCRRLQCDGGSTCNGHGQCRTLADAAKDAGWANGYTGWDADMVQTCSCDPGWAGVSCADRTCPMGDDPLTTESAYTTQVIDINTIDADATPVIEKMKGSFTLKYTDSTGKVWETYAIAAQPATGVSTTVLADVVITDTTVSFSQTSVGYLAGETLTGSGGATITVATASVWNVAGAKFVTTGTFVGTDPADGDAITAIASNAEFDDANACTAIAIREALEALPSSVISGVTVTADAGNNEKQYKFTVQFSASNPGAQKVLVVNTAECMTAGCQPMSQGLIGHDTTKIVVTATTAGDTENVVCSNRGSCDAEKGVCDCFDGYFGSACSEQTTIV